MARARRAAGSERARRAAGADLVLEVELLEVVTLLAAAVAPDGRHVEHALAELNERATLHRDVQVGKVAQDPVDELLELLLAQVVLERCLADDRAILGGPQPVLGEAPVEHSRRVTQLLLLLDQV